MSLDQSQIIKNWNQNLNDDTSVGLRRWAQTFTAGITGLLTKVAIWGYRAGSGAGYGDLTLEIRDSVDADMLVI